MFSVELEKQELDKDNLELDAEDSEDVSIDELNSDADIEGRIMFRFLSFESILREDWFLNMEFGFSCWRDELFLCFLTTEIEDFEI